MRVFGLLMMLLGSLFVGGVAEAEVPRCLAWNTPQCVQLRLMLVDYTATKAAVATRHTDAADDDLHYVDGLVTGMFRDSKQVAAAIFNRSGHRGDGNIKLMKGACRRHYVYAFNVNTEYSSGIWDSQEGLNGSFQKAPVRVTNAPLVVIRGSEDGREIRPSEVILLTICGGEGGLNVPVGWLTQNTLLLFCPLDPPLFPHRDADGLPLGHHFGPDEVGALIARFQKSGAAQTIFATVYRGG